MAWSRAFLTPNPCWTGSLIIEDICNFGEYDVPFSVAEYDIVNDILNDHCGDLGGWVFFIEWAIMYEYTCSDFESDTTTVEAHVTNRHEDHYDCPIPTLYSWINDIPLHLFE